jgi:putative endonuclease
METGGWVYILASAPYGTLYVGVTSNLSRRLSQHRAGDGSKFCAEYDVHRLVHAERFEDIRNAIRREKRLKKWNRRWKIDLIERANPEWHDLFGRLGWE